MSASLALDRHAWTDAMTSPSFEAVYREHVDFVWRNAKRLGVPAAGVDDVVQKVFLVVHRRLGELSDDVRIRGWLFQIVRRVARDERRAALASPATGSVQVEDVESSGHGPELSYALKSAAEQLHAILATMDEDKREVFVLADLEGFSAPEIAESISTNVNTVYARLRAARQTIEQAVTRLHVRAQRESREGGRSWNR